MPDCVECKPHRNRCVLTPRMTALGRGLSFEHADAMQDGGVDSIARVGMTGAQPIDLVSTMVDYILSNHPSDFAAERLPRDESLMELGVLDSAGVIEFIVFVESTWGIEISDEDITKERMGSLNKMAALVQEYLARKK